jgi:hypothetical protein
MTGCGWGFACLATGFGTTGFTASACTCGCSGAGAAGVVLPPPIEVGIQPNTAPIPTRQKTVTAMAATMTNGWV